MARVDEVTGEKAASASDLKDQAVVFADASQEFDDSGSARVGVESEPQMVDPRKIGFVVRLARHSRKGASIGRLSRERPVASATRPTASTGRRRAKSRDHQRPSHRPDLRQPHLLDRGVGEPHLTRPEVNARNAATVVQAQVTPVRRPRLAWP